MAMEWDTDRRGGDLVSLKATYAKVAREAMNEMLAEAKASIASQISSKIDAPAIRLECLRIAHGDVTTAATMVDFVMKEARNV